MKNVMKTDVLKCRGIFATALVTAILFCFTALSLTGCDSDNGGGGGGGGDSTTEFTSIADLQSYLSGQPANTKDRPYIIKLNVSSLGGSASNSGSLGAVLLANPAKYVYLDLSGSTFTAIPDKAFVDPNALHVNHNEETHTNTYTGQCATLTGIKIPNSVTSIGYRAFDTCTSLPGITIPDSVTSIGGEAFVGCTSLTSVTIGNGVTFIGEYAFRDCLSLTAINVGDANTVYSSQDGVLYNKAKTNLIQYPAGKTGAFTIPNSVTSIGEWAFSECANLTSVTIPDSVTSIGWLAFYWCTSLTSVTIGNGVTSIGEGTFGGCTSLTSVTIGNSVTSIGEVAFGGCASLTGVTIPNSVTSIGEYTFGSCTSLASVTIPDSVTRIGERAFNDCTSLTGITVDAGNTAYSSQDGVLYNKNKTTLIQYPAGKTDTTFTIPDSVTSIGEMAFWGCTSLTSVTFQGTISSYNFSYAFHGDLREKYLASGVGTYTTTTPVPDSLWYDWNPVWTKQ